MGQFWVKTIALSGSILDDRQHPSAAEVPRCSAWAESARHTPAETGRARESISLARGASAARCQVMWSPMTLKMAERARLALWKLAMEFAKPGPR